MLTTLHLSFPLGTQAGEINQRSKSIVLSRGQQHADLGNKAAEEGESK